MHAIVGCCRRTSAYLVPTLCAIAFVLLTPTAASATDCPNADGQPGQAATDALAQATICLLNEQRAAAGLGPLASSTPLTTTASRYAGYMVSTDHFAHQDVSGHDVVYRVIHDDPSLESRWLVLGENLGWGTLSLATPRAMVTGWMNSPTHRANILYPDYREIGVGIAQGAPTPQNTGGLTYATVFGRLSPPAAHRRHRRHRRARAAHRKARAAGHRRHHTARR